MADQVVPILHVKDAMKTSEWYKRLGFEVEGEHRFAPSLPLYMFLRKDDIALHLSEHSGDARPDTLLYYYVSNIEEVSREFNTKIIEQPWAREVQLRDPDGNRWRIGERRESD
ncbi:MAG: bleomycin resistance protein [Nitrospirales bacterium]|nr:MAG: bleomycin resistance protein [Nitrospirales bacterium]